MTICPSVDAAGDDDDAVEANGHRYVHDESSEVNWLRAASLDTRKMNEFIFKLHNGAICRL